jgi:hypothetical protein
LLRIGKKKPRMDKIEERLVFKGRNKTICKITVFFLAW